MGNIGQVQDYGLHQSEELDLDWVWFEVNDVSELVDRLKCPFQKKEIHSVPSPYGTNCCQDPSTQVLIITSLKNGLQHLERLEIFHCHSCVEKTQERSILCECHLSLQAP